MKRSKKTPVLTTTLKHLTVATLGLMSAMSAQAAAKQIGDLEIYQAAENGKVTIMMMLDTSGSMSAPYMHDQTSRNLSKDGGLSACDVGTGNNYTPKSEDFTDKHVNEDGTTTNITYTKHYCQLGTGKKYSYIYIPRSDVYYVCDNADTCMRAMGNWTRGKPEGYDSFKKESVNMWISNRNYAVERLYEDNKLHEDRLTRLKNALFALMNMNSKEIDFNKVEIGIGQYSTQTQSDGTMMPMNEFYRTNADNRTGKILVPAAKLTNEQRKKIKQAVAVLRADGGTPSAQAYAEAGAYMLGTTTKNAGGTYFNITGYDYISRRYRGLTQSTPSGFDYSAPETKSGDIYNSPLKESDAASCDGQGIYFLTDGVPNSSYNPANVMQKALGAKSGNFEKNLARSLPKGTGRDETGVETHGTPQVGAFARSLRIADNNPKGVSIRTAVVGFGSTFEIKDDPKETDKSKHFKRDDLKVPYLDANSMPIQENGEYKYKDNSGLYFDCTKIPADRVDARNACNWGAKSHPELPGVGGFGEGGFYSAQSTDDVVNSVMTFLGDLNNEVPSLPSGVITVPEDPYNISSQRAVAYMPMVQPDLKNKVAAWQGNLKKYQIGTVTQNSDGVLTSDVGNEGMFFGRNKVALYAADGINLNPAARDFWSSHEGQPHNVITSGGAYSNLKTPDNNGSQRPIYIEDLDGEGKPTLRKFSVNAAGELMLDGAKITASHKFRDALYTPEKVTHLLRFMGYSDAIATSPIENTKVVKGATNRVLGGILHSLPSLVSYSANIEDDGSVGDQRDEYVLYGAMDGALHLVDADDFAIGDGGKEALSIITKPMLQNQASALSLASLTADNSATVGVPKFGVDAPWLVTATYKYDYAGRKVTVGQQEITIDGKTEILPNVLNGINAFGGFRMGAKGLYGINLDKDSSGNIAPRLTMSFTPSKEGFARIGHIWAKPVQARIKNSTDDRSGPTDVLIFGGGYDMCYEDEAFQVGKNTGSDDTCKKKAYADGSAVYIVNAKTGDLLWSASSAENGGVNHKHVPTMVNSIVGEINVLDRDNDGFMDHLYFADLGGQVFRADFKNAGMMGATTFTNHNVVRVFHENETEAKYTRRFYEKPVIDFYADKVGGTFGLVTVASGDRSSPLSTLRNTNAQADRLYAIFDYDMTKTDRNLYASTPTYAAQNITPANLFEWGNNATSGASAVDPQLNNKVFALKHHEAIAGESQARKGWYYPLIRFEGYANTRYTKAIGKSEIIKGDISNVSSSNLRGSGSNSFLYASVYNPDMKYTQGNDCSAQIRGGTERQVYCLPWGVCMPDLGEAKGESTVKPNWLGGYQRAGLGIQELSMGPASEASSTKVILSAFSVASHQGGYSNSPATTGNYFFNQQKVAEDDKTRAPLVKEEGFSVDALVGQDSVYKLTPKNWYDVSATTAD